MAPDILVPADQALTAAYAAALGELAAQAADEGRETELRDLLEKSATP